MRLTDTAIKRLKPSEKCKPSRPDKHSDGQGLQLWVRHTGNKVWYSAYRYNGKQQTIQLGKYPILTLAKARAKNLTIKQMLDEGIDPKSNIQKSGEVQHTFGVIAEAWHAEQKEHLAASTHQRNYSMYVRDIAPAIGRKLPDDITPQDILAIGKRIEERGATDMARRTIRQTGQIFRHAMRLGKASHDPSTGLTERKAVHYARVTHQELPKLLQDVHGYTGDPLVRIGLLMAAHLFVRTKELRLMQWEHIDRVNKLWRIPADIMKMDRPHLVPLSEQALALLDEVQALFPNDKYVFYNSSTRKPYSQNAFLSALYNMGYKGRMTTHGFRGLASTILHEKQYLHDAIELQLAHDNADKVSAAYNAADHLPYRTTMMQEWSNFLDQLKGGQLAVFPKQA